MSRRLFRITYRDEDPACPEFVTRVRAWNKEDAENRFCDSPDGDTGWLILKIEPVKERS